MSKPDRRIIFTADARFAVMEPASQTPENIGTLTGYALVWNVPSSDRGGFKVRLMPGSAKFTPNVHALWHHDQSRPLGDTASGTLRLSTDEVGVRVEIDLPDTSTGRDTLKLVKSKRVRGMSFAMVSAPEAEKVSEGGETILNATSYTVDEVTITPIPSFSQTTIGVVEDEEGETTLPLAASAGTADAIRFARHRHDLYRLA